MIASLIAAAVGSGVGGWLSYKASKSAAMTTAKQSQVEFTRTQRQSSYLAVSSQVSAIQSQFDAAQYDSVPFGANLSGPFATIRFSLRPGGRAYVDQVKLDTSLAAVRDGVGTLVRDGGVLNVVASKRVDDAYKTLVRDATRRMDNLYALQDIEQTAGASFSQRQLNRIATYIRADAKLKDAIDADQSRFGRLAKSDLGIGS